MSIGLSFVMVKSKQENICLHIAGKKFGKKLLKTMDKSYLTSNFKLTYPNFFSILCGTKKNDERNWVFFINSDFLILISLQPDFVDLRYFKLCNFCYILNYKNLKIQTFTSLGCKDIEI